MPIVLQIVLKPKELAVFNTIQHMANLQKKFISYSMFVMYTGFDHKTIGSALKSLTSLRLISKGPTCKDGTHYDINAQLLNKVVIRLNKTLLTIPIQVLTITNNRYEYSFRFHYITPYLA